MCRPDIPTESSKSRALQGTADRVIIFDWDDTICPSTFVTKVANVATYKDLSRHFQNIFDELCKCAQKVLTEASKYGEVIIITSADEGWVEYSAERFVPKLLPVLKGIKVVSARSSYEKLYPKKSLCWKAAAFAHEVNEIFNSITKESSFDDNSTLITETSSASYSTSSTSSSERRRREIISFGDSMDERTAVKIVSSQLNASSKSVKFIQRPTPIQIIGQLSILNSQLNYICDNEKNIDVEISKSHAHKTAKSILNKRSSRSAHCNALKPKRRFMLHSNILSDLEK